MAGRPFRHGVKIKDCQWIQVPARPHAASFKFLISSFLLHKLSDAAFSFLILVRQHCRRGAGVGAVAIKRLDIVLAGCRADGARVQDVGGPDE